MAGLTMVRSWHTRDFLFVILAFLFVNAVNGQPMNPNNEQYSELNEAAFGYRSYPPMMPIQNMLPPPPHSEVNLNELNEAAFGYRSYPPLMLNHNLPPPPPHSEVNLNDPYYRMPLSAHALTPYEQPLNTNLELVNSPQYRSNPGGAMPFYEEPLNENLRLVSLPEYRSHHVEALPFYEETLNDNLHFGRAPIYRSHPGGDYTIGLPVSTFSDNMHPLYVPQEVNYRRPLYYYYPIPPLRRARYRKTYVISPVTRGRYWNTYVDGLLEDIDYEAENMKRPIYPGYEANHANDPK